MKIFVIQIKNIFYYKHAEKKKVFASMLCFSLYYKVATCKAINKEVVYLEVLTVRW